MAEQLTRFDRTDGSKINVDLINTNFTINDGKTITIAIIGQSRQGKSSFLNCLISRLKEYYNLEVSEDNVYFKSMSRKASGGKDVTKGMRYYNLTIGKITYCFIDVQGISGVESEDDPVILMFCYYIADLVIVNCNSLDANTLKMLEPIGALQAKLGKVVDNKPTLVFRYLDVEDDFNIADTLKSFNLMMNDRKDQVSGVRQVIKELFIFDETPVVFTTRPERKEISDLDKGNIANVLSSNTTFIEACDSIIAKLKTFEGRMQVKENMLIAANKINAQDGIVNSEMFDTVTRVTQSDIMLWIHGSTFTDDDQVPIKSMIPDELKKDLQVIDSSSKTHELLLERKEKIATCVDDYNKRFAKTPKKIRDQGCKTLSDIIMKPYGEAYAKFTGFINEDYQKILTTVGSKYKDKVLSVAETNNDSPENQLYDCYNEVMESIKTSTIASAYHNKLIKGQWKYSKCVVDLYNELLDEMNKEYKGFIRYFNLLTVKTYTKLELESDKRNEFFNKYVDDLKVSYDHLHLLFVSNLVEKCKTEELEINLYCYDTEDEDEDEKTDIELSYTIKNTTHLAFNFADASIVKTIKSSKISTDDHPDMNTCVKDYLNELKNELLKYKQVFLKTRADQLDRLLYVYHKQTRPISEIAEYYKNISPNNDVYFIGHVGTSWEYEMLNKELLVKVNRIRSKTQYEKDVPLIVKKYLRIINESSYKEPLINLMYSKWLQHLIENN